MSALSTPGGGSTTAQSKPTSGKTKFQKLDINSLYCANKNENSEPSSVKSQLSRKHGMQSLGKVPSARRPPANLPSLKTEHGQDTNANSISTTTTTTAPPVTCSSQTTTAPTSSGVVAGTAPGGWVSLPPPSSPHFRTEFPSLEAAAQPVHRAGEHQPSQPSLRPQTEGSWTSGGTAGVRPETSGSPAPASVVASQQTPALRAILPSFLMKGVTGGGGGGSGGNVPMSPVGAGAGAREPRGGGGGGGRGPPRHQPSTRAQEVLTARPILRDDQISSLDEISRDSGWAHHDDIDYNQKLDFSDGESNQKMKGLKNNNRPGMENDRIDSKIEPGDEDQIWAERRQKHNNEVAAAVVRARQRKEEEQRRRDAQSLAPKERDSDNRDSERERERSLSRDRHRPDNTRDKERMDPRERDSREKDRVESKDKERNDNKDRFDNRDRMDNRSDNRDSRDGRNRLDNRDRERSDNDKDARDRNDNRDRERFDRDRDRDDRERDFRDRDYGRERDPNNAQFSKNFQANMPPRFLKKQQSRQQDEQPPQRGGSGGGWAYSKNPAPRRQESQPPYNQPRHMPQNGRRSFSRDYSDREDDLRRDKDSGHQWRSEMHDYDRSGRELDRQNSKDSYKDYGDHKDRRSDSDRRSIDSSVEPPHSRTSAADKLSEVFERKSSGLVEPFAASEPAAQVLPVAERRRTPPSNPARRESAERDFSKPWAEVTQEGPTYTVLKPGHDKVNIPKRDTTDNTAKENRKSESEQQTAAQPTVQAMSTSNAVQGTNKFSESLNQHVKTPANLVDNQSITKPIQPLIRSGSQVDSNPPKPVMEPQQPLNVVKPYVSHKSEKDSETESIASKSSTDRNVPAKINQTPSVESLHGSSDTQKRSSVPVDDKKLEKVDSHNKFQGKDPVERKSSGSGSDKKGRGGGFAVYNTRGWGPRDGRGGRRTHRNSRSNRASESDGSTDGPHNERKDRMRRAPRSPRAPKKMDKLDDASQNIAPNQTNVVNENVENREPFAPRGQPSRRGRGGFQGASRPPAPAKRVTGYGPPNTKSPFSQANRAVKEGEENKDIAQIDDKGKPAYRQRGPMGAIKSDGGRGRERRPRGASGEDENWETTSEHSESGLGNRRRSTGNRPQGGGGRGQPGRNQNMGRPNNRNLPGVKKDGADGKPGDAVTEAMADLKLNKTEEIVDDGFQEVRNKKTAKDVRVTTKEESNQNQQGQKGHRSNSSQGNGRNGSSSRPPNDKPNARGSAPPSSKPGVQYERQRQPNLPPRLAKQRQKQQMGILSGFGPDISAAPPPPPVNAWDKPISQSLRANVEEAPVEIPDNKPSQQNIKTLTEIPIEPKAAVVAPCILNTDKSGVLDGTTPPVETIIFENTNYKTTPPVEALKSKYQQGSIKPEDLTVEKERSMSFNGDVRPPRLIQELMAESNRSVSDSDATLGLQMSFEATQKGEDSSDMKLDFAFDSDLGQLTDDKSGKSLGLPRSTPMSVSNTISPLAADLNFKIASVKKVWEMPAVAEGGEELQFSGFEEGVSDAGAPPNVCKVKPTQQLQSPPPQHYNHVGYQGYGPLSVPSPPAVLFNSSQQLLGSSQQGGLYGAFLDQSRGQFGGFPGAPYAPASATPYNYQPPPDMFQSIPNQYRMTAAAAGGGAAFGATGQLGNNPSTVLISSTSNSLMSASVKPSSQQCGAIGSKGGVGGVGNVASVGVGGYGGQYVGYGAGVGVGVGVGVGQDYSLAGLLPRAAPPANSYYSAYQAQTPPTYPHFPQAAPSAAFSSQHLSSQYMSTQHLTSQLQVAAAAVQQMQQQYRAPLQQQFQQRPPPQQQQQQLKSPLHEHANGFSGLHDGGGGGGSPTPKGGKLPSPPHPAPAPHKYTPHMPPPQHQHHVPPPQHHGPPPQHHNQQHHQQQQQQQQQQHHQQQHQGMGGNNGRNSVGNNMQRCNMSAPRYPSPIQRPLAGAAPPPPPPGNYRAPPPPHRHPHAHTQHHHRNNNNNQHHHNQYHYHVAARQGSGGSGAVPAGAAAVTEPAAAAAAECATPDVAASEPAAAAASPDAQPDNKAD